MEDEDPTEKIRAERALSRAAGTDDDRAGRATRAAVAVLHTVSSREIEARHADRVTEAQPTIERAYRVRLSPTPVQARVLNRLFGARRYVWNWAIATQRAARAEGVTLNAVALSREFTQLRQQPETAWLAELPREPFNQTLRDLDRAWSNWRRGDAKPPTRKRFGTVQSARFTLDQRRDQVDRVLGRVQLDGIGKLRFRVTEPMLGRLRSVTVSRDAAGRWFASFTADGVPAPATAPAARAALGIDVGLKTTAAFSDGTTVAAPKHLAAKLQRLRRYQRQQARQRAAAARRQGLDPAKPFPKGTRIEASNRMRKTQRRIGVLHARIADARRNHQHHVSAAAVAAAQVIVLEDLDLQAMSRSMGRRAFRRGVADAGLGEIRRQVTYKAQWHGRTVVTVDRWYPSSKTCSACGQVHADLQLSDRTWTCACGAVHDRDRNAALNIECEGLRILAEGSGDARSTRRRRGTHARGEAAAAGDRTSSSVTAHSTNRELISSGAQRRTSRLGGLEPSRREAG